MKRARPMRWLISAAFVCALAPSALAADLDMDTLRGPLTVHYHLGRLQRFGLARRTRSGRTLVVLDPPPLTRWGRFRLQLLR